MLRGATRYVWGETWLKYQEPCNRGSLDQAAGD